MKKVISILLVLIMLLGLCSCGDAKKESNDDNQASTQGSTDTINSAEDFDSKLAELVLKEKLKADISDNGLLAPAQNSDKLWGYINVKGEWVIEPNFMSASCFSDGYAMVLDQYYEYAVIDRSGNTLLTDYKKNSFSELSYFSDGYIALALDLGNVAQKYLYFNTELLSNFDAWDIPDIRRYSNYHYYGFASLFKGGKAVVMRLLNSELDTVKDNKGPETAYVIDTNGDVIASLTKGLDPDPSGFDDKENIAVKSTEQRYGLCNSEGTQLIACIYRRLIHISGNTYLACNENGFWGYVDQNGNTIIDFKYQKAYPFTEGLAAVYDGNAWGFINESGETVIDFMFDDVNGLYYDCSTTSLNKAAFVNGVAAVLRNNHWVLIDRNANPVFALNMATYSDYDKCPFAYASNGLISFAIENSSGNNYGLVNTKGEIVIENGFLSIGHFK